MKDIVNFLFEAGMLAKTPRSGFQFLGTGKQSVSEHTTRTCFIGFVLAQMNKKADSNKIVMLCLFHDLTEARGSDLNYVHQKYNERKLDLALKDLTANLFFGDIIKQFVDEFEDQKTNEARFAKDADNLEFLLCLKEEKDIGNPRAINWMDPVIKRLVTVEAKQLAETIIKTDSDEWWFQNKKDPHWVNGK